MINRTLKLSCLALLMPGILYAQNLKKITLPEAVQLGIENSKNLKLSQNKIEEARARLEVVKDNALPTADASFLYNHAEIPTHKLSIGGATPFTLPNRADAFIGTAAVQELVYGGGKLKYARESTRLLAEVAGLDADRNKEEVSYAVIDTYFSLYKLMQSKKVVAQNLASIASQLKQAQRFFEQGIVTKNDVLRFQLQQSNITLTDLEIESNRKVVNYNLDILLGLPEDTELEISNPELTSQQLASLSSYMDRALSSRQELQQLDLRNRAAESDLKSVKANTLPTVGVGANLYYINPSGKFIPPVNQYIMPVTLGATLSWNIGSLWTNKNKVSESRIQQKNIQIQKEIESDQVKTEVNRNYQGYQLALNKISILETSIAQAVENDRLLESKYKNNVASAIDRIDAETLLYQAKINLEIAKADAGLAYYTLLKSTGKISQ
ncbi:TolC family protein [Pedobacter antarcticus]|uniref:Transporter n=2 Tax=Pedobacter antarcticus TaxID=34086 RepID=A0A081PGD7_9SPHI|nr:TolC family protein [Pedobacter antarcticus]KEQ29760.1 transporter [Pedobacter antarcticus 4BY]SDM48706.1 Outer membrane protein TolC [Pedobacter antarcticus]SFE69436.1 Outer membrane protein TolC [Pedobacter antarcticus]